MSNEFININQIVFKFRFKEISCSDKHQHAAIVKKEVCNMLPHRNFKIDVSMWCTFIVQRDSIKIDLWGVDLPLQLSTTYLDGDTFLKRREIQF